MTDDVSLREHLSDAIGAERRFTEFRLDQERRLRIEFVAALFGFGAFAWSEIQRRLSNLNHEAERIKAAQTASVSADTYAGDEQRRKGDQDRIETQLRTLGADVAKSATKEEVKEETRNDRRGTIDTTTKLVGAIGLAVVVLFAWLNYQALHRTPAPATVTVTTTTTTP